MVKDSNLYVVKRIVDRKEEKGRVLYLVRWKGYGSKDDTWEPIDHLTSVRDLIEEFEGNTQPPATPTPVSTPKPHSTKKKGRSDHKQKSPSVPSPPSTPSPSIQGALDIDEIEQLSNIMWRQGQREYVCEVEYKPRVSGVRVKSSVERLADVRYRCPQLVIDLFLRSRPLVTG